MTSALKQAIDDEEPIVVTLWYPHWAFQRWDLKLLDDPKNEYGDPDTIYSVGREGFKEDFPAAFKVLSQFHLELEDNEAVMADLEDDVAPDKAAKNFVKEHQDLMDEWTKGVDTEYAMKQTTSSRVRGFCCAPGHGGFVCLWVQ